ncbi:hypothetical protein HYS30_00010 [Candidatus Peregrinibacteria bacterium]|nr:hypothetical protein [Candidatus Peregrinibacteria bacterium]
MPSREQLALSFGNAVLALQETYHKKAGEYLEAVARHEYVEGLFDLAQNFRTAVQRKAEANGRGIENIPALVCELAWAERRDIGEDLIKLADHALEEVMTEANNQMYERYKKCKEERSKGFLSLFRGELHYGDMYDVGGWDSVEFRLFAHVAHKAREILNVRHLLRRA